MKKEYYMSVRTLKDPIIVSGAFYEVDEVSDKEIYFFEKRINKKDYELALIATKDILESHFIKINTDEYEAAMSSYEATRDISKLSDLRYRTTMKYKKILQ